MARETRACFTRNLAPFRGLPPDIAHPDERARRARSSRSGSVRGEVRKRQRKGRRTDPASSAWWSTSSCRGTRAKRSQPSKASRPRAWSQEARTSSGSHTCATSADCRGAPDPRLPRACCKKDHDVRCVDRHHSFASEGTRAVNTVSFAERFLRVDPCRPRPSSWRRSRARPRAPRAPRRSGRPRSFFGAELLHAARDRHGLAHRELGGRRLAAAVHDRHPSGARPGASTSSWASRRPRGSRAERKSRRGNDAARSVAPAQRRRTPKLAVYMTLSS